jgi:hypothetical protein
VFALTLRRELLPLVAASWVATLLCGCLGFVVGVDSTFRSVADMPAFSMNILTEGIRRAGGNLRVGLTLAILVTLLGGTGGFRMAWRAAR